MKNIRKLVTVVLTLSLTLSLAACGSENSSNGSVTADREKNQNVVYRTLDEIKESGTINIGVFSDKNPFGYVDENGEYQGYDVYFANRIGEYPPRRLTVSNICRLVRQISFWQTSQ